METGIEALRPYSDAEQERIMDQHFREEAERKREAHREATRIATERALAGTDRDPEFAAVPLSPEGQALKARVLAAMARSRSPKVTAASPVNPIVSSGETLHRRAEEPPTAATVVLPLEPGSTAPTRIDEAQFPVSDVSALPEFDDPQRELTELCRELQSHKSYEAVRTRYCHLSICMNLQGKVAPAFRIQPSIGAIKGDPHFMPVFRDQLVIDYHWLHATRVALSPTEREHVLLLDLDIEFDFAAAWALAHVKHTKIFRAAEALCLTPFQQCQTRTLHSAEMRATIERICGGWRASGGTTPSELARVKRAIGQWIEQDKRIAPERHSYEHLWQAKEMLGPGASNQLIADLHALMLGEPPLDRKTVRDKLNKLHRRLGTT